jgi:methyl-accepting chemotaxis protein
VELVSNDELAEVGAAFNQMKEAIVSQMRSLATVLDRLRNGLKQMESAINVMFKVSEDQSSAATEQAAAATQAEVIAAKIMESARNVAELAGTVDHGASSTLAACKEAEAVLSRTREGFDHIARDSQALQAAATELEQLFKKTYLIVELIEEISDQIELLALNASIEAAGAGEEGKRFAVVAEETMRLAQRTPAATARVRALVEAIEGATAQTSDLAQSGANGVVEGAKAIGAAEDALKTISRLASSTSQQAKDISLSTASQTMATEQLSAAIREVGEVARQVERSAKELVTAVEGDKDFNETLQATLQNEAANLGP